MISLISFIIKISLTFIVLLVFTYNDRKKQNVFLVITIGLICSSMVALSVSYNIQDQLGFILIFICFILWFLFNESDSLKEKFYALTVAVLGIFFGFGAFFAGFFMSVVFYGIINYFDNIIIFFNPDNHDIEENNENNIEELNN